MRKADWRSYNQGSNTSQLFNVANAKTNYNVLSNDDASWHSENEKNNSEYKSVRRTSAGAMSSKISTVDAFHQRLSPTATMGYGRELRPVEILQKRRHSQQALSSHGLPEFVITSASRSHDATPYSRGDRRDCSIYCEDGGGELRYYHSRPEICRLEDRDESIAKADYERRWSSGSTEQRLAKQEINSKHHQWENSKGVRYQDQRDPSYFHTRNDNAPRSSTAARLAPNGQVRRFCERANREERAFSSQNLLSVPGYESTPVAPTAALGHTIAVRSRSHSTPSSPDLIKFQGELARASDRREEDRRSSSPDRSEEIEDMHSPYYERRDNDQMDDVYMRRASHYALEVNERPRKHSYGTRVPPAPQEHRIHQGELRRIATSATCVVTNPATDGNSHRRRILPPTPDQLLENAQKLGINPTTAIRKRENTETRSLPKQQATQFYCEANSEMERVENEEDTRVMSSRRQIASTEVVSPSEACSTETNDCAFSRTENLSSNQREETETSHCVARRTRRATDVADSAMIPASAPSNHYDAPRSGTGRKLPETPTVQKNTPPTSGKMPFPFSFMRQNTVGELLHQKQSSPTLGRFNAASRRVSEQMFLQRSNNAAKNLASHISPDGKSSDADESAAAASAWLMTAAAISAKSHDQITHSRSNVGVLSQLQQGSFSSSSSVPDLITTPTKNAAGLATTAGVDAATDSGHGSGAESGVGDGATVSGSNSWPDAIGIGGLHLGTDGFQSCSSSGLGFLHFTIQYFPVRKRLRVSVIKAERLAGELRKDLELHTFVKLCLMPGKVQKQRGSRIVKRTRDASFNEEFFFDNITHDDLESKSVFLRLCHHVAKQFQKDVVIGQAEIGLKEIMPQLLTKHDVKMCQELKPKQLKKLGRLSISTCLEYDANRLTINIFKVDDLPKFGISGPPDPCVRISVDQNGKVQTKQSRVLKSTCHAVFKEAVMFLVSTKRDDLERTKIVVAVHDMARTGAGDDVIGNVYLGQLACDKSEIDQWRNTLLHPKREFKTTHQLKKEPNSSADDDFASGD